MSLNIRHCSTLTLLLVTLHISGSEGQGHACNIMSRPHPQGICGLRLSETHSNLCFLLRQTYPQYFPSKRSTTGGSWLKQLYRVPLSALSELNFSGRNRGVLSNRLELSADVFTNSNTVQRAITEVSLVQNEDKLPRFNDQTSWLFNMHDNLNTRMKRVASQSSMVCDCCLNVCTARHLATYC